MAPTPLLAALSTDCGTTARPLRVSEYRGAETPACFTTSGQEFSALLHGCGVYDLGYRGRISLTGNDRTRWLNGMVTNNIRDLAAGRGVYTFLLNPQGKILGDMYCYNLGESTVVETDRSQIEKILATFDHYIIMDDVEVKNVGEEQTVLGLAGPNSRAILKAAGIEIPELQPLQIGTACCTCDCECVECTVVRGGDESQEIYELWLAPKDVCKTWQALIAAGAITVGSEALEMQRIAAGIPLYGIDIRERDLPQETEQMRALNFNKGCYVGQEIVERIRSRGNVHRKFASFLAESDKAIAAGEKLFAGEKEVGEITSSAVLPTESGERTVALGYIRREAGLPGREVTIGSVKATVIQLPLAGIASAQPDEAILHKA
jgi:folate-binding protein YgfZ